MADSLDPKEWAGKIHRVITQMAFRVVVEPEITTPGVGPYGDEPYLKKLRFRTPAGEEFVFPLKAELAEQVGKELLADNEVAIKPDKKPLL